MKPKVTAHYHVKMNSNLLASESGILNGILNKF